MRVLLIAYDNDSYIHTFPTGLAYIASALEHAGHVVDIYSQDVHHYPDEHLTQYLNVNHYDAVGVGVIGGYYQYRKLLKISHAINSSHDRPKHYILGSYGPSPDPEFFLRKTNANYVVIGEGDATVVDLLSAIETGRELSTVEGIAYVEGTKVIQTPPRALIKDIDSILWPAYEKFDINYYKLIRFPHAKNSDYVMPILSARGCTFKCNFCYRMDKGYRARSPAGIIEEIKFLQEKYKISYIEFSDELLMSSTQRVHEICEAFLSANLNFKWFCCGRLNYASKKNLELMKKAGCVFINYGIESLDDTVLKNMNKALNAKMITTGIENTIESGISPGFNIIFGNIGDTRETLQKGVDFLKKYDDGAQLRTIRPVTPYPGSPLYYDAINRGLLKDIEDFYENKHVNSDLLTVNFTNMSDDEFHSVLMDANSQLLTNYYENICKKSIDVAKNLYLNKETSFRGFRQT